MTPNSCCLFVQHCVTESLDAIYEMMSYFIVFNIFVICSWFLEKYFEMKKGHCKEALDIYKKFLTRMTRVSEFLKVAEVSN